MTRATLILALLLPLPLLGGCVTDHDKDSDVVSSASPRRYEDDPDKKKQVCEDSLVGGQPKTVCY